VRAPTTDKVLVNGWGLAATSTSAWWTTNEASDTSALYSGTGRKQALTVSVPGGPTGIVAYTGRGFRVSGGGASDPARFIYACEDGRIRAWTPTVPRGWSTQSVIAVDEAAKGAIFRGVAVAGNRLYATDFHNARVDVFDGNFKPASLPAGAFTDPHVPKGFAPFGIQAINGDIVVTYAKQDENAEDDVPGKGLGFVDVFDPEGTLVERLDDRIVLNAPWGVAIAPASFGRFGGALLVGNFGDGTINAFSPTTGRFIGSLRDAHGRRIRIDGLWGIQFGNGVLAQDTSALYAAAGPADESHGTYSVIRAR
jgi:uncharacterized protein (TIGR03118 family)